MTDLLKDPAHWRERAVGAVSQIAKPACGSLSMNHASSPAALWLSNFKSRNVRYRADRIRSIFAAHDVSRGLTTDDLFGFLTTEPNDVVGPVHLQYAREIETCHGAGRRSVEAAAA